MELANVSDERIVAAARDQLASTFPNVDAHDIETIVSEELQQWRKRSRVQTFVPIFAQRSARERVRLMPQAIAS